MAPTTKRKTKFSLLDLRAEVSVLQERLGSGSRVLNVYNLGRKTYLLKLSVPPLNASGRIPATETEEAWATGDSSWRREYLLIESGVRLHTTRFTRQAAAAGTAAASLVSRQKIGTDETLDNSIATDLAHMDLDERDRELQLVLQRHRALAEHEQRAQSGTGANAELPSGFTLKLRKHLRTRRLAEVTQLGIDRVVDFRFVGGSQSASAYKASANGQPSRAALENHLIVELHSGGNIILTDGDYQILAVLRVFRAEPRPLADSADQRDPPATGPGSRRMQQQDAVVGARYDISLARQFAPLTYDRLHEIFQECYQKRQRSGGDQLRDLQRNLGRALGWGPELIEHVLLEVGAPSPDPLPEYEQRLYRVLCEAAACLTESPREGYILLRPVAEGASQASGADSEDVSDRYCEFTPRLLRQHQHLEPRMFPSFDEAVDEYFARMEELRYRQEIENRQRQAQGTLERMRRELETRVLTLKQQEERCLRKAALIETNLVDVDNALQVIRAALASGIDWKELDQMLVLERRRGNPVAQLIHSLQLQENQMTLMLADDSGSVDNTDAETGSSSRQRRPAETRDLSDEDSASSVESASEDESGDSTSVCSSRVELVQVDLSLSAFANARRYYEQRKKAAEKGTKTMEASAQALRAAEKKALEVLAGTASKNKRKKATPLNTLKAIRKPLWFEKFRYFITSENYLVIAGKDSQQNEQLVRRYLEENTGDLYMHADVHGAASVIIKGKKNRPAPPLSIQEAAIFAAACSSAWDAKVAVNAYWVYPEQVSRTAPSGMYLQQGSFVIRGSRNYVPVTTSGSGPLVMGFGFLFRLAPESVWRHIGERPVRSGPDSLQEAQAAGAPQKQQQQVEGAGEGILEIESDTLNATLGEDAHITNVNGASRAGQHSAADTITTEARSPLGHDGGMQATKAAIGVRSHSEANGACVDAGSGLPDVSPDRPQDTHDNVTLPIASDTRTRTDTRNGNSPGTIPGSHARTALQLPSSSSETDPSNQSVHSTHAPKQVGVAETLTTGIRSGAAAKAPGEIPLQRSVQATEARSAAASGAEASRAKPVRGKKSKLRKLRLKYSDQTEEEREAALRLLGTTRMRIMEARDREGAATEAPASSSVKQAAGVDQGTNTTVQRNVNAEEAPASSSVKQAAGVDQGTIASAQGQTSAQRNGTSAAPATHAQGHASTGSAASELPLETHRAAREETHFQWQKIDQVEVSKILQSASAALAAHLSEAELANLSELDLFTGCPHPDDVLEYALPVCAPYQTLAKYKYKVKLVPGTLKKGKALKQVLGVVQSQERSGARTTNAANAGADASEVAQEAAATARELELIQAVDETVLVQQMLGNVRVLAPGLQESQRKKRTQKKSRG